jgi:hypothetical protein
MEVWKQVIIDNIECDYEISNHGNLRCKNTLEPRIFNTHRGCYTCKIKVGKKIKLVRIARLVAQYFIPNNEELRFIKHINGNVYDNRVENLKWSETSLNDGPFIKKKPTLKIHPTKNLENEIWKTVVMNGVEWDYEVSNLGRVRSNTTKQLFSLSKRGNYLGVSLQYENKRYTYLVHRLVAIVFINNDDETKKYVNHKNHNPIDNRVENLEWVTISENSKHSHTKPGRKTVKKVVIRYDANGNNPKRYESVDEARKEFGINVGKCLNGTMKTAYGYIWKYESEQVNKVPIDSLDMSNFKKVDNHPLFLISSDGKVYNTIRKSFLKPRTCGDNNYANVVLDKKGYRVHVLVAKHFIPNDNKQKVHVNHKDGNKLNNCVENLEWVTHSENIQHAFDTNLRSDIKSVAQYTLDNEHICTYISCSHASKALNTGKDVSNQISRSCKKSGLYRGYIWKFV